LEGGLYDSAITYNRAVSPMVNVSFVNLITDVQLSQQFFQPSLGQTQQVTANFTANCNWTLLIQDLDGNTVLTTNGAGDSMGYNWDGTGQGETNIPDGMYSYIISAETNGLANEVHTNSGGGGFGGSGPPIPGSMMESRELYAVNTNDSESVVPLAILPPGYDTNGYTIFSATPSEIQSLRAIPLKASSSVRSTGMTFSADDSGGSGASSQSDTNNGPKNTKGTFGIVYQQYLNPNVRTQTPLSGYPFGFHPHVAIDGNPENDNGQAVTMPPIVVNKNMSDNFVETMEANAYWPSFVNANDQVNPTDLESTSKGGNSIFNNVDFGLLMLHASYGTTAESDGVKYSYVWIENAARGSATYLRLADFNFGGSSLQWLAFYDDQRV
jgi:hypothetical protein